MFSNAMPQQHDVESCILLSSQSLGKRDRTSSSLAPKSLLGVSATIQPCAKSAVTRIRTGVAAATTQSTNHYTITADHGLPPVKLVTKGPCPKLHTAVLLTTYKLYETFGEPLADFFSTLRTYAIHSMTSSRLHPVSMSVLGQRPSIAQLVERRTVGE